MKSPDLYQRAWAVQTLSRIKPLPEDAAHALTLALRDKSEIVSAEAADALKGNKVDARNTIRDQDMSEDSDAAQAAEQALAAFKAGQTLPNSRSYSKEKLGAPVPPDENHEYPFELRYLVSVAPSRSSTTDAEFLVTVHRAKEGKDRLAVWKKTGDDRYEQLLVEQSDGDESFDEPTVFSSKVLVRGQGIEHQEEEALFVDLPLHRYWGDGDGVDDTVLVVDRGELRPVEIQSADDWYAKKLRPGEWTWNSLGSTFADNDLEFEFLIWEESQCHACSGGAEVNGTYKVIKEMHHDAQKKHWVANWKMVVDTAKREPRSD